MKLMKFIFLLAITIALIYALNSRLIIGGSPVPPLGKFLDPYHGFWQNAQSDSLTFPESIALDGLKEKVTVKYDDNGVPHIFAQNKHDLYMTQGYLIAQDRLWQMEFQTHAAAGRVSEIIGAKGLDFDRLQRRKGMVYGAKATYATMQEDHELYGYLEAYAAGVNTYINSLSYEDLPIEYKLLGYTPEPWTSFKSALILEYMVDNLTGYDEDLENTNTLALFGKETYNFLFPERLPGMDPIVPTDPKHPWDFTPVKVDSVLTPPPADVIKNALPKPDPSNGSNNWAVAGNKTVSGHPILANDTHLGLNLPSLWYMMQLHTPDMNVYGFTFTGAIGITIGFNDAIAWGFTNAPRDHRDWYKVSFEDEKREKYQYNNEWRNTKKQVEEIKIRDGETYYDTVIYTHHGPVVYDKTFGDEDARKNYALHWIGHEPSRSQRALYMLNGAKNCTEYLEAITYWDSPPQNIVFASTSGDIALWVQGNFTAKWKGQGKFLMDGSNPVNEWQAPVPKAQNAYQHNPERGFVSSANQHPVDSLYPYWVYDHSYEHYRNRSINRALTSTEKVTPQDMMTLQQSSYVILAEEILPLMLDSLVTSALNDTERQIVETLKKWDYRHTAASTAPTYFQAWWEQLRLCIWDEFDRDDMILELPDHLTTSYIMKKYPNYRLIDVDSTKKKETLTELVNYSFHQSLLNLNTWQEENDMDYTWGNYKGTFIRHLADLNKSLAGFSHYNIQVDGQAKAINATKRNHGPSERLVVEMSSPPKAWGIYPGGQSGNPGSPMYDNMIDLWRDGEYLPLLFMTDSASEPEKIMKTQTFEPIQL